MLRTDCVTCTRREAAQADLRPRLTVQFVVVDEPRHRPVGLNSSGSSAASAAAAGLPGGGADTLNSGMGSAANGSMTSDADTQDAGSGSEDVGGAAARQPDAGSQREHSRAAKPEFNATSSDDAQGALEKTVDVAEALIANSTADAADAWQQDSDSPATGVSFSATPAGKVLIAAALILLAVCIYILRRALARRKARTGNARSSGGSAVRSRLNRFLARRRTAESDAARP